MIAQITPFVQTAGRRVWLAAFGGHIAGAVLSASLLGFILSSFGLVIGLGQWQLPVGLILAIVLLACALREVEAIQWRFPSLHRQTPRTALCRFGPIWGAFAWGFDLGQGWTTYITFTGYYGLVLWTVLSASPAASILVLGAYGLGRALPVLVAGSFARRVDIAPLSDVYIQHVSLIHKINAVALAFVAGFLLLAS